MLGEQLLGFQTNILLCQQTHELWPHHFMAWCMLQHLAIVDVCLGFRKLPKPIVTHCNDLSMISSLFKDAFNNHYLINKCPLLNISCCLFMYFFYGHWCYHAICIYLRTCCQHVTSLLSSILLWFALKTIANALSKDL